MLDKIYRLKEIVKHPVNIYDRYYYWVNSISFDSFIKSITGEKEYEQYNDEFLTTGFKDEKRKFLFLITRIMKPSIFVETGVGASTKAILAAMNLNKYGNLYSIDLLPQNVCDDGNDYSKGEPLNYLRGYDTGRWQFIQGDSKVKLPELLNKLYKIDMFFHDSLHTYEHMLYEYQTAWKYLNKGGLLLSDDVYYNHAFLEFAKGKEKYICNRYFGGIKVKY